MAIRIFNTLSKKLTVVRPRNGKIIRLYSCGPTVYDYAHIGNLRAYVFLDVFKRYLKFRGYKIKHVMNITDVDDKTIRGSRKSGKSLKEYTVFYFKAFIEDIKSLNIELPDVLPLATEHTPEMIKIIAALLKKRYAYKADDGSVYYRISKFKNYGKLAGIKLKEIKEKMLSRVHSEDQYEKEEIGDFALWKAYKPEDGDVFWKTPFGKGRPGWHIECSAMSMKYLGKIFDIHTGGIDLIFPHHTNEIAQSEALTGRKFVNCWLHNAHLLADGQKMSKSLGNFYTLKDITSRSYHPLLLRYVLMRTHFQETLDFTFSKLDEARHILSDIIWLIDDLHSVNNKAANDINIEKIIKDNRTEFIKAMDENLNISNAFKALFQFVSEARRLINRFNRKQAREIIDYLYELDAVLGFLEPLYKEYINKKETLLKDLSIVRLLKERTILRKAGNFQKSDKIRNLLLEKSIRINDLPNGRFSVYIEKFL